jgi:hypothetical protein
LDTGSGWRSFSIVPDSPASTADIRVQRPHCSRGSVINNSMPPCLRFKGVQAANESQDRRIQNFRPFGIDRASEGVKARVVHRLPLRRRDVEALLEAAHAKMRWDLAAREIRGITDVI